MTKETAPEYLPLVQALADGKTIQYLDNGCDWQDVYNPDFTIAAHRFCIKPERKLRAWKNSDVPLGCFIRAKIKPQDVTMVTGIIGDVIKLGLSHLDAFIQPTKDSPHLTHEYSTDNGKTWQPCGVFEE